MIKNPSKSDSYFKNGLIPLLNFISENGFRDTMIAFESFNEPEWMIVGNEFTVRLTDLEPV